MKPTKETYNYHLALNEKRPFLKGRYFLVTDSNNKELYKILTALGSAYLYSLPNNKCISRITPSSIKSRRSVFSTIIDTKKIGELDINGYGILKAREGTMTSTGWKIEYGPRDTIAYDKDGFPVVKIVDETRYTSDSRKDLFKCTIHFRDQSCEMSGLFILLYIVCEYISVKEYELD